MEKDGWFERLRKRERERERERGIGNACVCVCVCVAERSGSRSGEMISTSETERAGSYPFLFPDNVDVASGLSQRQLQTEQRFCESFDDQRDQCKQCM